MTLWDDEDAEFLDALNAWMAHHPEVRGAVREGMRQVLEQAMKVIADREGNGQALRDYVNLSTMLLGFAESSVEEAIEAEATSPTAPN